MYRLFFDGCSKGNPGPAGAGWALFMGDTQLACGWSYLGRKTSNVAEYEGLIDGLTYTLERFPDEPMRVFGDSMLVVKQVNGKWKCKAAHLEPYRDRARAMLKGRSNVSLVHIPREKNAVADRMSNVAVEEKNKIVREFSL